jgi:hypothetical protein
VAPPTDPNVTHGNAAINRREYADLFAGDRKKKNTDALLIDEPNIIAAKMAAFDKFETDGAKFWRSMSKADPDGSDFAILRRSHKGAVRAMGGVITFLGKYTELITDPTASDATSTATTALPQSHRASRAAVVEGTASPPAVNDMTTSDSMTASTSASTAALASDATSTATTAAAGVADATTKSYMAGVAEVSLAEASRSITEASLGNSIDGTPTAHGSPQRRPSSSVCADG